MDPCAAGRCLLLLALLSTNAFARSSVDLDVGWISRQPEIDYVLHSANPRVEGWPVVGEPVTWRAHVRNWSGNVETVAYEWLLDRAVIASGTATFAADAFSEIDLTRPWTFDRHQLTFRVDTTGLLAEESETNNELTIFTDALAVGFWVEDSVYRFMRENQQKLAGVGSASFEDWIERHIAHYNEIARLAIYPETPAGVLDRWRIQKIVVVPDGALPLVPVDPKDGNASSHPNDADRTIDLSWGFPSSLVSIFDDLTSVNPFNPFYVLKSTVHELGHARYLIDVYGYNVKHLPPSYRVEIEENGVSVVGNLMPASMLIFNGITGFSVHEPEDSGLMVYDYDWIDRHSAAALNLIAGSRAVDGTANVPGNYAAYLNDLPAQNRITIRDRSGSPVPNASVDLFQGVRASDDLSDPAAYLSRVVDDVPDLHFTTDSNGQISVGRNPFTSRGPLDGYRLGELTAVLRVRANGTTSFGFLESRAFNLAYWRGETVQATHDVFLAVLCSLERPNLSAPAYLESLSSNTATLTWQPVRNAQSYTLWASIDGQPPAILADHTKSRAYTGPFHGRVEWWVESHTEVACPSRRSLTYAFITPGSPSRRRAVGHP